MSEMKEPTPAPSNFSFFEPMMALRVQDLPVGNWLYEMKFDGYRALAFKAGKEVRLVSPNQTLFNEDYPNWLRPEIVAGYAVSVRPP
jgi:bifunctional non-homologous end joining protein LigD